MKKKSNRLLVKALGSNTALTRVSSKSNTIVSFSKLYKGSKSLLVEVFIKGDMAPFLRLLVIFRDFSQ